MARQKGSLKKEEWEKLKKEDKEYYEVLEGTEFYVLKEGETENVDGLKSALERERAQSTTRQQALEALKDVNPEKYRELLGKEQELQRMTEEVSKQLEANNKQWEEKLTKQTQKLQVRAESLMTSLEEALIDRSLLAAAGDKVLSPKIWLMAAKSHVRLIEEKDKENDNRPKFRVEVIDPETKTARISAKDKSGPMTLDELVEDLGTKDEFKPLYKALGAAGSGSGGQQRAPAGGGGAAPVLSREEAMDPQKYRAAREASMKAGQGLPTIEPLPPVISTGT